MTTPSPRPTHVTTCQLPRPRPRLFDDTPFYRRRGVLITVTAMILITIVAMVLLAGQLLP